MSTSRRCPRPIVRACDDVRSNGTSSSSSSFGPSSPLASSTYGGGRVGTEEEEDGGGGISNASPSPDRNRRPGGGDDGTTMPTSTPLDGSTTGRHYHLTILIPAYNERRRIGDTLSTYMNYLRNAPVYRHRHPAGGGGGGSDGVRSTSSFRSGYTISGSARILVIDDGSRDGTANFIDGGSWRRTESSSDDDDDEDRRRRANDDNCWTVDENVTIISLPNNSGKGAAIERGMAELPPSIITGSCHDGGTNSWGRTMSVVLVADADGSGDISCIDDMLRCMEEMLSTRGDEGPPIASDRYAFDQPPAVVVGRRNYLVPKSPTRALLSWGFKTCLSIIFIGCDLGVMDTQCGFKLMTNSAGKVLYNKLNLRRWTHDVEVIHRARVIGIPVGQCSVPWVDKDGSKLVTNKRDAVIVSLAMLGEIANMRTSPSPWSSGMWRITLDFGKNEESPDRKDESRLTNRLANDWGSNGGRLALSFELLATSDTNGSENKSARAWLGGEPTGTVECISHATTNDGGRYCASYVNERGQQYLLLLQSNAFRTQQYISGITTLLPYQYAMESAQRLLEDKLNHDTGDRRLDGKDLFETLGGYRDIAELVAARDARRKEWAEIEGFLPKLVNIDVSQEVDVGKLVEDENRWGVWPGDTELMTVERGLILAVVEKEKSIASMFPFMQQDGAADTVVVGKWSLVPIFDDHLE
ncbi:hypothetical protein ACHAXA_004477 [Cyclostephanos tholiformis]|uniref:Glycosyltransferase 2-like domain-containing protein n=1 Tax=Cyclostephanos tholiformis TaxID=382380 RepID=A0ABD3RYT9_9STRA